MTSRIAAALLAGLLCAPAVAQSDAAGRTPPNTLSKAEQAAGWKLLFDGKSLDGWRNYKKEGISSGWKVEDGALVRADKGAGDIISKEQFDNFELLLEYKISPEGNSGVMFHVNETSDRPWHTGPEIQIQDNAGGHDPQSSGWLYQLYQTGKARDDRVDAQGRLDATNPPGEWNQLYVRVAKQQSAVILNGFPYYQFVIGSDDWNQRVAKSKFAEHEGFAKAGKGHICLQDHGNLVAFRNIKVRKIEPNGSAQNPVHGAVAVKPVLAFPELEYADWDPAADGKVRELRPIIITNAGDGSNRLFVGTQLGQIHVFPNKPDVKTTKVFLDLTPQVAEFTGQGANEEGLLGLAFHPKYKENGLFYVYYTKRPGLKSIVSEFRVSKGDPDKADPKSERILMTIDQPFKNHNGGSIEFGHDGYLYIGLGDGGAAYDPHRNGQNLGALLGKILRIDVDTKSDGKEYGIPKDNPFVGTEGALPEIYAYGFRNPWRIGFDRKTGQLWTSEVGQDLWEEINIVKKGGNYGWSGRESLHPFADGKTKGSEPLPPVWEYDHQVGKSITGGAVYRGKTLPELEGHYLYGDYVTGKLWALKFDEATGEATGNFEIAAPVMAVTTYGEDEAGEVYFGVGNPLGKGLYKFESTSPKAAAR